MTILDIVAVITIPLIGVIGYLNNDRQNVIIDSQKSTNEALGKVVETLNQFSIKFENHEGRLSRAQGDIETVKKEVTEIKTLTSRNTVRINRIEGVNQYGQ